MDKRFAIFDMDGTLVDSMGRWKRLATEFLHSKGVTQIPGEVLEQIKPMTMTESAALFAEVFGLKGTPEELCSEMNAVMDEHYRRDIPLKAGVAAYLEALRRDGVRMCVASATAEPLMDACLRRLGVLTHFEFLLSCEQVGVGKNRPDVYFAAAKRLGASAGEIAVYEDAFYAVDTAKTAGFYVVGVYDESADRHWKQIQELADESIRDF